MEITREEAKREKNKRNEDRESREFSKVDETIQVVKCEDTLP